MKEKRVNKREDKVKKKKKKLYSVLIGREQKFKSHLIWDSVIEIYRLTCIQLSNNYEMNFNL